MWPSIPSIHLMNLHGLSHLAWVPVLCQTQRVNIMPTFPDQSGLVNLPTCDAELVYGVLSGAKCSKQTISKEKGPSMSPCLNPSHIEICYQKFPEGGFLPILCLFVCLFGLLWIELSTLRCVYHMLQHQIEDTTCLPAGAGEDMTSQHHWAPL